MSSTPPTSTVQAPPGALDVSRRRLVGIDVARGLAILGMFVAHLGDDGVGGRHDPAWFVIADGRSAALFALLAGTSLALISGRQRPPAGAMLTRARLATLVRAVVLLVVGWFLVALGTPVAVILPAYAVLFVMATPFLGLRRRWLVLTAGVATLASPTLIALLTTPSPGGRSVLARTFGTVDPVRLPLDELVTGYYPALVFIAYVLVGLAVGRTDLTRRGIQVGLALGGSALAALGWGTSRLVLDALGGGAAPLTARLVGAAAHDNSTLEVVGNVGTSLAVIGICLLLTAPGTAVGRVLGSVLHPVAATGAMSLSVYSIQIVVIAMLGDDVVWFPESNAVLIRFVVVALAVSWLWRRFLGKGPLERAVAAIVRTAIPDSRP
ncbi:MAG: acyltransferase family protein [Georgenia sp.]